MSVTTNSSEQRQQTNITRTQTENSSYQIGSALSGLTSALQQIEVTENKQNVTVALPRKGRRAQSLPRGQISSEESSFRVSLPGSARTSRQARYLLFITMTKLFLTQNYSDLKLLSFKES